MPVSLDARVREMIEREVGASIVGWSVRSEGLTHALTGVATFRDGSKLFVKAAKDERSAEEIRREIALLSVLDAPFLPELRGAVTGPMPLLLVEDLSSGHWPEPYPQDLSSLSQALHELRRTPIPSSLALPELEGPSEEICRGIVEHAAAVAPELGPWLETCAGEIIDAALVPPGGRALVHADLWYSNLCFLENRVVIVDWSYARIGSPWFDTSTVNIDLVIEGRRPLPMQEAAKWAAAHLAWSLWSLARGPGPGISDADRWRLDNLELVDGAAWWIADELALPAPPVLTDRTPGFR